MFCTVRYSDCTFGKETTNENHMNVNVALCPCKQITR